MGAEQSHGEHNAFVGEHNAFVCAGSRQSCNVCCGKEERRKVLAGHVEQATLNAWAEALVVDSETVPSHQVDIDDSSRLGVLRGRTYGRSPSQLARTEHPHPLGEGSHHEGPKNHHHGANSRPKHNDGMWRRHEAEQICEHNRVRTACRECQKRDHADHTVPWSGIHHHPRDR